MTTAVKNINTKVLILPFYKQYQILLGMVYLVMFGAVRGDQLIQYHKKLIEGTLSSYGAMVLVFTIWAIYFVACIYFLVKTITNKQNTLLQQLTLLPKKTYRFELVQIVTTCLLPISTYAAAIIVYAFVNGFILKGCIVFALQLVLHIVETWALHKHLNNVEYNLFKPFYFKHNLRLPKKYAIQFYIKYLFTQQALQWLLLKLVCFVLIKALFHSETPDGELRFSIFLYVLFFMIHTSIVQQFVQWNYTQFWHLQMLPLSGWYKYGQTVVFLLLLVLPEVILLSTAYPTHLTASNTIAMMLLSIATILFIFSLCVAFNNVFADYSPMLGLYLLLCYGCSLANTISAFSIIVIIASCITYIISSRQLELAAKEK